MKQTPVTVHYLFSRSEKIGSKVIASTTKKLCPEIEKTPSHVAILINEKWVFESTLESGVNRMSYKKWKEKNEEVAKIKCTQDRTLEEVIGYFREIKDKKYDYMAIIYFSWRVILLHLLNLQIPAKNKLNNPNRFFCTEVVGKMTNIDCQMTAPVKLLNDINLAIK